MTEKQPAPNPRDQLIWLAVDLDGTLAEKRWSATNPTSEIGEPIWENIPKLKQAVEQGYKIVIHTARPWSDYEAIELWLNFHGIPYRAIVCGKLLAAAYVDDRAIHADEKDWVP